MIAATTGWMRAPGCRVVGLVLVLAVLAAGASARPASAGDPNVPALRPSFTLGGGGKPAYLPVTAVRGAVAVALFLERFDEDESVVRRRFSTDGGETWSTSTLLYDKPATLPQVAIVNGAVHAVFVVENPMAPGKALALLRTSTDGGETFGPPTTIGGAGRWLADAHLAGPRVGGYKNTRWVTWLDDDGHLRLWRQRGASAPTVTTIEASAEVFLYNLANDGNNVYVLAQVNDSGAALVWYKSTNAGLTFPAGKVIAQPRAAAYQGMALSAYGFRVAVAWKPPRSKSLQVRISKDRGATFGKPLRFKGVRDERVALSATLDRIEMVRVVASNDDTDRERLLLYVLPKRGAAFGKPIVLRRAKQIGVALLAPPAIGSDNQVSLYSWFEYTASGSVFGARAFLRAGLYPG